MSLLGDTGGVNQMEQPRFVFLLLYLEACYLLLPLVWPILLPRPRSIGPRFVSTPLIFLVERTRRRFRGREQAVSQKLTLIPTYRPSGTPISTPVISRVRFMQVPLPRGPAVTVGGTMTK